MSNVLCTAGQSSFSPPRHQTIIGDRPSTAPSSLLNRLLSLPDRKPCMRYVYDITILALAVIAIIGILVASHGQGLLLFGLIPGFVLGTLGLAMLVSDIAQTPRAQKIADTLVAVCLPFILLGIASALLASAFIASGGSILIVANPLFIMGIMTIGLSLISLHKVTFQHFKTEALVKQQQKIIRFADQPSAPLGVSKTIKDEKLLAKKRNKQISESAKYTRRSQQARLASRRQRLHKCHQGNIWLPRRSNAIEKLFSSGYEPDFSNDEDSVQNQKKLTETFSLPTAVPSAPLDTSLPLTTVPLGSISSPLPISSSKNLDHLSSIIRTPKIEKTKSRTRDQQEEHQKKEEEEASSDEKLKKKKLKRKRK
ncbi:hypothetical protein BOKEGFJH_00108 [Chlamydia avium]|uniref:Inner membrane protein n=1 Tax=Chlamydia avium TaxID=1457141 RepID=A0ABP2X6B1_9CHLA|nr:IncV family inclusion membrane protein [Chlamydia avium]EPP37070.1 hypothetical protein CP10743SC13_0430 [Chlamydia psittaci 10_743_SC13]EPP38360.1 hypothetical protein CP10881SC42_0518 [Chlamydia avium]VVT42599.1 hypothetical protein BOKEGFJH_00108 [Chlamydia avium]